MVYWYSILKHCCHSLGRQSDLDTIRQSNYSRRGRSSWKSNSYRGDRHDSGPNPRSRLDEDDDGDFEMEGGSASSHSRRYMTVALSVLFLGKNVTKLAQAYLSPHKKYVHFNMFLANKNEDLIMSHGK